MTKKECAIVMAYTGIAMLTGEDFQIYHKYIEDIMGRPVWTHELANESVVEEIKEKSKYDFLKLCEKAKLSVSEDSDISREALLRKLEQIREEIKQTYEQEKEIETKWAAGLKYSLKIIDNALKEQNE